MPCHKRKYCITAFEIVEIKFDLLIGGYRYSAAAVILPIRAGFFVFQDFLLWQDTSKNCQLVGVL